MTNGDDPRLRVQLRRGPRLDFSHRHQNAALDSRLLKLPGLAYVEQNTAFWAFRSQQLPQFPVGNFIA